VSGRLEVRKTYKLFIGGAFPRSESGRSYQVVDAHGQFLANAAQASRKDARDAVVAARKAFPGWSGATAYNRGQILYRIAEMLEGRRAQFDDEVARSEGLGARQAAVVVGTAIDRWVHFAGWTDKVTQVAGSTNPVAGPYFNISSPEPTGVVAILAPQDSSLLGLIAVLAPVLVTGNTAVVLTSEHRPLPAVSLAEVLATSDLPAGVVNILTGRTAEVAPWLASHMDVNAIDLAGAGTDAGTDADVVGTDADAGLAASLEVAAADNLKRVRRPDPPGTDYSLVHGPARILDFTEIKTVWHPIGV